MKTINQDRYQTIAGYCGVLLLCIAVILLLPLLILTAYPHEANLAYGFLIPSAIALLLGYCLKRWFYREDMVMDTTQGAIIVTLGWMMAILFSALPFMLTGQLNFTQAVFEATSGWTTAGLSVVDVENTSHLFLLWRSTNHFFGGVGLVAAVMTTVMGPAGMGIFSAEGHSDRLAASVKKTARIIVTVYTAYVLIGVLLYIVVGMPWFDAINHSIASVSTGGFSTRAQSIGYYNSFPIELVTILLMILGNLNFAANFLLIKGKWKRFFRLGETKTYLLISAVTIPLVALSLNNLYPTYGEALRRSLFEITSAFTTTGYSLGSFTKWRPFAVFAMVFVMLVGGGAGSTAGGIKQYRIYILYKNFVFSIKKAFLPGRCVKEQLIWQPDGKSYLKMEDISDTVSFVFIFMLLYFTGVFILTAHGYPLPDSMFEFASALSTVGVSMGITSAAAPPLVLWTETVGMFLGRLEIMVVIIAILRIGRDAAKSFSRKTS